MDRYKCEKHGIEWIGKCPKCLEETKRGLKKFKPSKSSMGLMLKDEVSIITPDGVVQLKNQPKEFAMMAFAEAFADNDEESKE